jgi:uncharacterized OB-fold protein
MIELISYSERRKIREELERSDLQGESLDPTIKCKCRDCGIVHFRPRKESNEHNSKENESRSDNAPAAET